MRPGDPCPNGCVREGDRTRRKADQRPESLALTEDGQLHCPACWGVWNTDGSEG